MTATTARLERDLDSCKEPFCTSGPSPTATVHLVGAGLVGRAVLALCAAGEAGTMRLRIVGATDSTATVHAAAGLDVARLARQKAAGRAFADLDGAEPLPTAVGVDAVDADVVLVATPSAPTRAVADHAWADAALRRGACVAFAAKTAPARGLASWLADPRVRRRVGVDATLGGTGRRLLDERDALRASTTRVAIAGSASTTTIVDAIEAGASLDAAVAAAGRLGVLEPDPALDLVGRDAAVKLAIVASVLLGQTVDPVTIADADATALEPVILQDRARRGATTRLVGRFDLDRRAATLAYEEVPAGSPLAVPARRVAYGYGYGHGADEVVRWHFGSGVGPVGTATALVADAIALLDDAEAGR